MKRAKFIFSNKLITIFLLVLQLLILAAYIFRLRDYVPYIYGGFTVISTAIIIYEINREEYVDFKISWLVLITAIPVFGGLLYIFLHADFINRGIKKKAKEIIAESQVYLQQSQEVLDEVTVYERELLGLSNYIYKCSGNPTFKAPDLQYFSSGAEKFECLLAELEKAKKFIFIEYFIVHTGIMWDGIFDVLKRKAAEGVEVRIMYDGMGSMITVPNDFGDNLKKHSIKCKVFSPIIPLFSTHQNNRDHRKIVVIDGHTAFTGGINIADEYINQKKRFGIWKDTAIMIKGSGVKSFTIMFLQLWNISETKKENYTEYLPADANNHSGNGYIIPYSDAPLDYEYVGMNVYLNIIESAKNYVYFMTPYLILPSDIKESLKVAVKRGVDVRIIMPHIPDKKYTFFLSRTYYPELIQAGVKIYEYTPGFIHSKMCISDDVSSVVGTINLDYRSLFLHYECALYVYKNKVIDKIKIDFSDTMNKCIVFTHQHYKKLPVMQRIIGRMLRLLAPLM